MLIDAGIGPRTTAKRMAGTGLSVEHVRAICLTHLDSDHFRPSWLNTIRAGGIRVFCHDGLIPDLLACMRAARPARWNPRDWTAVQQQIVAFDGRPFEPLTGASAQTIRLAHDRLGSHGFVVEGFGCRIGYATDLGRVSDELLERFCDLDVLALESNYDRTMQISSSRPWHLKQRIMGGRGHLSNDEALAAVRAVLDRCTARGRPLPGHIVLLHRSRECNCPKLVRNLFGQDARIAPRLTLAEQFQRTPWLRVRDVKPMVGEQLHLAWS
jgi:phosphoribosyl 1,2-cyclic phosphodiesterase